MTNFKHLSKAELLSYSSSALENHESRHEIGRHLLNCAECRKLLPMPSIDMFWAAIMIDAETADAPPKEESKNFLLSLSSFLKFKFNFVGGSAALIVIFSFSFLLWLGSADTGTVVQTFENEISSGFDFPSLAQAPVNDNPTFSINSNRFTVTVPTPKNLKSNSPKTKSPQNNFQNNPSQESKTSSVKQPNEIISATRGISAKCSESISVEMEFSSDKENFVFRWKAVPRVTKYHLYISDDEEILIDEFETETETSFILSKPLDAAKTYQWKVVITTENGKTIVGESRKFTVKSFQLNRTKSEKTEKEQIRCLQNN